MLPSRGPASRPFHMEGHPYGGSVAERSVRIYLTESALTFLTSPLGSTLAEDRQISTNKYRVEENGWVTCQALDRGNDGEFQQVKLPPHAVAAIVELEQKREDRPRWPATVLESNSQRPRMVSNCPGLSSGPGHGRLPVQFACAGEDSGAPPGSGVAVGAVELHAGLGECPAVGDGFGLRPHLDYSRTHVLFDAIGPGSVPYGCTADSAAPSICLCLWRFRSVPPAGQRVGLGARAGRRSTRRGARSAPIDLAC